MLFCIRFRPTISTTLVVQQLNIIINSLRLAAADGEVHRKETAFPLPVPLVTSCNSFANLIYPY